MEVSPVIQQVLIALDSIQDAASRALMTEKEHQIVRANGTDLRKWIEGIQVKNQEEIEKPND